MKIYNAKYELTAVKPEQYPQTILPEVAFVGRSNVGKSSLINSLLNRKNLARVGSTPGKTREVNFYNIDETLYFVDLPGYGYAGVSKQQITSWSTMVETYLNSREQIKLILMLIDIRHSPSELDKQMHSWLISNELDYIVLATKADKLSRAQQSAHIQEIRRALDLPEDIKLIPYSSEKAKGKDEAWKEIISKLDISQ